VICGVVFILEET
jgi:hypothetical protein